MRIFSLEPDFPFGSNTYILESENEALVIDPALSFNSAVEGIGFKPQFKYIVITHAHFDHFLSIDDWVKNTGAEVVVGYKDAPALSDSTLNAYMLFLNMDSGYSGSYTAVSDGDSVTIGKETLKFTETPGHTVGSVTLLSENSAFVGDVIFSGFSIGRTDLPGGDYSTLQRSINKILSLPEDTVIYPGHGPCTTVKKINEYRR